MKKLIILLSVFIFLINCKNSKTNKLGPNAPKRTIVIKADDNIKFDKSEIKVKQRDKITLILKNVGKALKLFMGHNFLVLKKGVGVEKFANEVLAAAKEDYIPNKGKDVIAHTKMLGGGESDTIIFDSPEKGFYSFICSFPGHWATMKGKFIVE